MPLLETQRFLDRDFIERVKAKAIGQEVVQSIQPGQQIIKIIHDELVELLGSANAGLQLSGNPQPDPTRAERHE